MSDERTGSTGGQPVGHADPPKVASFADGAARFMLPPCDRKRGIESRVTEQLVPTAISMTTTVSVHASGRVTVSSRGMNLGGEEVSWIGLVMLFYGDGTDPEWLWSTAPVGFGIDPVDDADAEMSVSFTQDVDVSVLDAAKYVAIKQFLCPSRNAWADIKQWLAAAQAPNGFAAVRRTATRLVL